MAVLDKIEFEKFGPYRFIGKSVYARAGANYSGYIFGGLWQNSSWVFNELDKLKDYTTKEIHNVALLSGDKYDERKKLMGYTIGRFMKSDTPVPDGMDFFDIPEIIIAKGWLSGKFDDMIGSAEGLTAEAISKQEKYAGTWEVTAEVYTNETVTDEDVSSVLGYYIGCKEK